MILNLLKESAANLGIQPAEILLSQYKWLVREDQVITVRRTLTTEDFDLTDPSMIEITPPSDVIDTQSQTPIHDEIEAAQNA